MNEPLHEREQIWDEFLLQWPLAQLPNMALQEYTRAGDKECFTYWLESRTEGLGSIWGGSAFKFGIFGRKDQSDKQHGDDVAYTKKYAWLTKYGATAQEAFEAVRQEIVAVANAARKGDLAAIEKADLGPVTKWKIAFLYQDRQNPQIINIFKLDHLRAMGSPGQKLSAAELHPRLAAQRGNKHILTHADELWAPIQAAEAAQLATPAALKFLQDREGLAPIKPPTEKMAGFRTSNGRELALARDNKTPTLYLEPGPWLDQVSGQLTAFAEYGPSQTRSSALPANAPSLAVGTPLSRRP